MTTKKLAAIALVVMLPVSGCLGLFGGDETDDEADSTSLSDSVGNETAEQIQERTSNQFKNYTLPGQEELPTEQLWFNGSIGPGPTMASWEDRNDRSGNRINHEIITNDISSALPPGQPAELSLKLWYFGSPGSSGDLDLYVNVPGLETEHASDDCDAFNWKVCVQEKSVTTVGTDGPAEIGVQVTNNRAFEDLDYFLRVEVTYAEDVITPAAPYAFEVPENATGIVIKSEKAGGSEHIDGELLVIGPDDELVEYVEYNDLAIPTESKLIPVSGGGEYIIYPIELHGGFLSVEADVPVDKAKLDGRMLETATESVEDGSGPTPGFGCAPIDAGLPAPRVGDCRNETIAQGDSSQFSVEGTFPLEIHAWIGGDDAQQVNVDAEVRITSSDGLVYRAQKFVQAQNGDDTAGLSRDELNFEGFWENLAKGEYTVTYAIDGTATVGHTVTTYTR